MLDQGFTVAKIKGIPVRLHVSLILFLPFVAFAAMRQFDYVVGSLGIPREGFHLPSFAWGILLAVGLFVAVTVHELAHSLVAIHNGAKVRSITLMMLGGVSLIQGDLRPAAEAWMAFAGPLASFGISLASYAIFRFVPLPGELLAAVFVFAATNALLGVFNLLPAFPMDGGRIVRAALASWIGQERATVVAAKLGKAMALIFVIWALWSFNLILLLIAWFVYSGATAEQTRLSLLHGLRGVRVTEFMSDRLGEVRADEPVGAALATLLRSGLVGARVIGRTNGVGDAHAIGAVTTDDLEALANRGRLNDPVSSVMNGGIRKVRSGEDASHAVESLASGEASAVVVVNDDDYVLGIVTPNDLRRAAALGRLTQ